MNETVKEWVEKAEGDYGTARREFGNGTGPNFDAVCFHAQQCVEKLMKALLIHHQSAPPNTHNLVQLHELVRGACPGWHCEPEALLFLSQAAVAFRYPGVWANRRHAERAVQICDTIRTDVRTFLEKGEDHFVSDQGGDVNGN
jgi:HEPN domain-containing protein